MILLDANVILRYLMNDIEDQALAAESVIIGKSSFVTLEVLAEVVYVLSGVYKIEREQLSKTLISLLNLVRCVEQEVAVYALITFGSNNIDFVDCLLYSYKHIKGYEIVSFDKKLLKLLSENKGNT